MKTGVAIAGRLGGAHGATAILSRFGAVSTMRGLTYWSTSESSSTVLVKDAWAVEGSDPARKRRDFTASEVESGAPLYFAQLDNRSSAPVLYRMRALSVGSERIVIEMQNVTRVQAFGMTVFPSGSLRSAYFVQRLDAEGWGLFGLLLTRDDASAMVGSAETSYVNRAEALFKHYSSSPTIVGPVGYLGPLCVEGERSASSLLESCGYVGRYQKGEDPG